MENNDSSRAQTTAPAADAGADRPSEIARIAVVGAGTRFLSGVSYYTIRLANALAARYHVTAIPMRQLLPTRLYPGRGRVGADLTKLTFDPSVDVLPGVDWYWLPRLPLAIAGLVRHRPDVVVFEWWTGTVLHTYVALAIVARLLGATVVVEFHEVLDTGEDRIPLVRRYVALVGPLFAGLAHAFVIHSEADRRPLALRYHLGRRPVAVIPHGPFDHYPTAVSAGGRTAPADAFNVLCFGVIRPFKGVEDLIEAFDGLSDEEAARYWLTVVGETWEGWDVPIRAIEASRHRDRITLVNRYVRDDEVAAYFAAADAVALPYHRSSASGPLHVAMSAGLPIVVTQVGGLPSAVEGYEGAILVPPHDPAALRRALLRLSELRGRHFADPHSWTRTVDGLSDVVAMARRRRSAGRSGRDA